MAYNKTIYANGTTPALNAANLNNNENKVHELDFVSNNNVLVEEVDSTDSSVINAVDALLSLKISDANGHYPLYFRAIYRNYGSSGLHAVEFRDSNNAQLHFIESTSSSFVESTDEVYFNKSGIKGIIRIDWTKVPNTTVKIFKGRNSGNYGILVGNKCFSGFTITDTSLSLPGIAADGKAVSDLISSSIAALPKYPFDTLPSSCPLVNIIFNTYVKRTVKLVHILRNYGNNHIYAAIFHDGTNQLNFLNEANWTEANEVKFNTGGYSGTMYFDWSLQTTNTDITYNKYLEQSVYDVTNSNVVVEETYPYKQKQNCPIYDIWFNQYDPTKKYRLAEIGKKYTTYGNNVYYVRLRDDSNNSYLVLNVLTSQYVEKAENEFNVSGISGKFWIDWNAVADGLHEYSNAWFSDDLGYTLSEIRNDILDLQSETINVDSVIPGVVYGVVGHPFSIYYYQMFKKDNLDDYHIQVSGASSHVQNLGNRLWFDCQSSGTHDITVNIRKDGTGDLVSKSFQVVINAESIPSIKMLFIGDSFVDEGRITAELKHLMGNNLTLYGTRTSDKQDSTGTTQTAGWSLYDYCTKSEMNNVSNAFWDGSKFNFSYYMTQNSNFNDVTDVFILSGPNDNSRSADSFATYYQEIIDSIQNYSNSIRIHCLMPLTCNCLGYGWGKRNYNGGEEYRYKMFDFAQAVIDLCDNNTDCFAIPSHLYFDRIYDFPRTEVAVNDRTPTLVEEYNDNVHPNQYGYFCMADMIFGDIIQNCN